MNSYKQLFEGRFTTTLKRLKMNPFEKLYYNFSPATYTEKLLVKKIYQSIGHSHLGSIPPFKILDIGCGGGCESLTKFGEVTGVDVSAASVENAKSIYHAAFALDVVSGLPFLDNEFDFCYSSEVLGHISAEDKNKFLMEIKRVLKPNGFFVISSETSGNNWYTRWLKSKNLYEACWVDPWGHIGLISPSETLKEISSLFLVKEINKTSTWVIGIDSLMVLEKWYKYIGLFRQNTLRRIGNMILYIPFRISLIVSRFDSANGIILLCQKESIAH